MSEEHDRRQARSLWRAAEAVHAVTYFHPSCLGAMADAGTRGFWMAYFVGRMAPLGPVGPEVAEAVAFGFSPVRPARALPDGWARVAPAEALRTRASAAADALTACGVGAPEPDSLTALDALRRAGKCGGRPLGAANRAVTPAEDGPARLWQLVTWLREQRGDLHVALWVGEGLDGCEANVLTTAIHGQDPDTLRVPRAWSTEDWSRARGRLAARGLLTDDGTDSTSDRMTHGVAELAEVAESADGPGDATAGVVTVGVATPAGRSLHASIEARTDALCAAEYHAAIGEGRLDALVRDLEQVARPVLRSGIYPFPNPMGLPDAGGAG